MLYDVSATNPWSSKLEQGGRYNLYSAVLSAELARKAALKACESIGIISPDSVHARLRKMILDDSGDARLRHLRVSTVHRFQGLEQDAIIFDVGEGPMPRFGPSGLVDGSELASQAAKLINVSITRPKRSSSSLQTATTWPRSFVATPFLSGSWSRSGATGRS